MVNTIKKRLQETSSEVMRQWYGRYFREQLCRACKGQRLRPESRAVLLAGRSLVEVTAMTVAGASKHFSTLGLKGARAQIATEILKEVNARLGFLLDVGLEYLTLDRAAATLSGGEAQRIRLASQLGSELSGVMYVLDEPSIGLHQRDNLRLIGTLRRLRDLGNSVLVVEHDAETIESADHVIDFGPGAGRLGGRVVAEGTPDALKANPASLTGRFMAGSERIEVPETRRPPRGFLTVKGAREHNLKNIDVAFPLGVLVAVTGVSGAGKSSLINGILQPALRRKLLGSYDQVGRHGAVVGIDQIDKVIDIDQKPIGRTPRSNPATYTKAFDCIRDVFAQTPEARAYGYQPGRFSFNVKGGRCEACEGDGVRQVEMHFLPDVYVTCEVCRGKRYNEATLRVKWKDRSIAEVLETTVSEALGLFEHHRTLRGILQTLDDVGLGYIALGQSATTLSGGEAQRIKLSRELAEARHRQDALPPRRADHRPPLRGRAQAAARARPAGRVGQHGARHRAQPRRHQGRRLRHRPRPRGRRARRRSGRRRHARRGRPRPRLLHRPVPRPPPRRPPPPHQRRLALPPSPACGEGRGEGKPCERRSALQLPDARGGRHRRRHVGDRVQLVGVRRRELARRRRRLAAGAAHERVAAGDVPGAGHRAVPEADRVLHALEVVAVDADDGAHAAVHARAVGSCSRSSC